MYKLIKETENSRTYRIPITGTELKTHLIYTDQSGRRWWAFDDLQNIPFSRKKAIDQISRLFGVGLDREDIDKFVNTQKNILQSRDMEKYEKAYTELMQFQSRAEHTADPLKQSLGICTVYILTDKEDINGWNQISAMNKMNFWSSNSEAQNFFLEWLEHNMEDRSMSSSDLSLFASALN